MSEAEQANGSRPVDKLLKLVSRRPDGVGVGELMSLLEDMDVSSREAQRAFQALIDRGSIEWSRKRRIVMGQDAAA